jgi:hypothetical protein
MNKDVAVNLTKDNEGKKTATPRRYTFTLIR